MTVLLYFQLFNYLIHNSYPESRISDYRFRGGKGSDKDSLIALLSQNYNTLPLFPNYYPTSCSTLCGKALACASIAVDAWKRI